MRKVLLQYGSKIGNSHIEFGERVLRISKSNFASLIPYIDEELPQEHPLYPKLLNDLRIMSKTNKEAINYILILNLI